MEILRSSSSSKALVRSDRGTESPCKNRMKPNPARHCALPGIFFFSINEHLPSNADRNKCAALRPLTMQAPEEEHTSVTQVQHCQHMLCS